MGSGFFRLGSFLGLDLRVGGPQVQDVLMARDRLFVCASLPFFDIPCHSVFFFLLVQAAFGSLIDRERLGKSRSPFYALVHCPLACPEVMGEKRRCGFDRFHLERQSGFLRTFLLLLEPEFALREQPLFVFFLEFFFCVASRADFACAKESGRFLPFIVL